MLPTRNPTTDTSQTTMAYWVVSAAIRPALCMPLQFNHWNVYSAISTLFHSWLNNIGRGKYISTVFHGIAVKDNRSLKYDKTKKFNSKCWTWERQEMLSISAVNAKSIITDSNNYGYINGLHHMHTHTRTHISMVAPSSLFWIICTRNFDIFITFKIQ